MNFLRFCSANLVLIVSLLAGIPLAEAKNLTHRIGVGFKDNTSESIPSIAAVYYALDDFAFTSSIGFDSKQSNNVTQFSMGLRKIIYFESNLNFYVSGQAGVISYESPGVAKTTGSELMAAAGAEFFFTGLENLGFTVETGIAASTLRTTRIRTMADNPFKAGVIFYF